MSTAAAPASGAPRRADGTAGQLWLRFLSGPDIGSLGLSSAEIVAAVEDAVRAHGGGHPQPACPQPA